MYVTLSALSEVPGPLTQVYGANLGIRLSAYLAAGGYLDLSEHEDVDSSIVSSDWSQYPAMTAR